MAKTTNILDLNNRLEKVEKGNIAQNNYNSLKNRPKINGNLLTGDKTGTQLGLAEAQDVGNISALTTTDKSSCVVAINEVNGNLSTKQNALRFITKLVSLPYHSSGDEWDYADVSFGVTFKSQPLVTVLPYRTGAAPIPISLVEVTTTGCKIGTYRGASTTTRDCIINAVGEVAT